MFHTIIVKEHFLNGVFCSFVMVIRVGGNGKEKLYQNKQMFPASHSNSSVKCCSK